MFLIAIVDDNEHEWQELRKYIENYFSEKDELCVIHQFTDGVEFIQSREKYNIVFLEAQIKEMDGLEAAHFFRIVNKEAQIVFVTHMTEMAVRGYEVDAVDFMIKPVNSTTVSKVLDKTLKRVNLLADKALALKTSNGLHSISSSEIKYIEVYDHDLIYHTGQGDFVVRGNLGEVYKKLENYQFIQCNRSYLVNMRYVKSVHKDYVQVDDTQIRIAKSRQKEMEERFIKYLGKCI